jgi:hypothetical protein
MKLSKLLTALIIISLTACFAVIPAGAVLHVQSINGDFRSVLIDVTQAGLVAGQEYTLYLDIESTGTTGFRIRYTDAYSSMFGDGNNTGVINSNAATARGSTANQIPALFNEETIPDGSSDILIVNFTHGVDLPDLAFDPSFTFIGVYGFQGGWNYRANGVLLADSDGNTIADYGTLAGASPATLIPAAPEPEPEPDVPPPPPPPPPASEENEPEEPGEPVNDDNDDNGNSEAPAPPPPAPSGGSADNTDKSGGLLIFLIILVAVIFGGATGGAIFLKKG